MRAFARLYASFMRVSIAANIQYRGSGFIWMIGSVLEPVVFLTVWSVAARSSGGAVGGMEPQDFAAYYIAMMLMGHLTFSWIMEIFQYRIQHGALSLQLLRPLHPIHEDISDNLGYKLVMMVVMAPALIILVWVFEPAFELVPWSLGCALVATPLAFLTRFCIDWTMALSAFWTTRVSAINRAYYAVQMFLSGRVAPVGLLPGLLQGAASVLPFYYVLAFPVELLLGRLTPQEALRGFGMLLLWLVLGLALLGVTWRLAVRRFSAVGS